MKRWWIIYRKEMRENLRDRRAVMSSLVMGAMFGPLLFAALITYMAKKETDRALEPLSIPVVGAAHAPHLVDWLRRQGAEIEEPPKDPAAAVRDHDVELVVEIPEAFGDQWRNAQLAQVHLYLDNSRRDSRTTIARVQRLLEAWGAAVGANRLLVRGIDPSITRGVQVLSRDLSTPESRGAQVLAMLPYLLMVAILVGGMYIAIDVTAGERERRSMEPLLLNPVSPGDVVSGKILAVMSYAMLALVLTLIMFRLGITRLPVAELGLRLNFGPGEIAIFIAMMLPVALLIASLQTLVAAFSKSFREAQTYLSFLMIIPLLPVLWLAISPVKPAVWMMWVPLLNQSVLIQMLSRAQTVAGSWHFYAWVSTAVLGVIAAWFARYFYSRPEIVGN